MKIKIERMNTKTVKTSRGDSEKVGVYFGGKWFGAWKGQWNAGWAVGQTIDIPDDRIKSNESNGKTYWNIEAPPKAATNGTGGDSGFTKAEAQHVMQMLQEIRSDIMLIKQALDTLTGQETEDTDSYQQQPVGGTAVDDSDIPF